MFIFFGFKYYGNFQVSSGTAGGRTTTCSTPWAALRFCAVSCFSWRLSWPNAGAVETMPFSGTGKPLFQPSWLDLRTSVKQCNVSTNCDAGGDFLTTRWPNIDWLVTLESWAWKLSHSIERGLSWVCNQYRTLWLIW